MLKENLQKAVEIINRNDRGGFTIPTNKLYPHQWNWDSAFFLFNNNVTKNGFYYT